MAAPTLSIHTIHGSLAGIPSYTTPIRSRYSIPSIDKHALVNARYPLSQQTKIASSWSNKSNNVSTSPRIQRPLRSLRRAPPPPPSRTPTTKKPVSFPPEDPFTDIYALPTVDIDVTSLYHVDSKPARTRLTSQSCRTYTVRLPQNFRVSDEMVKQRAAEDRETRLKVFAGILLNRVHAVGKPMRRIPPNSETPKPYKRSGLSRMISVNDM